MDLEVPTGWVAVDKTEFQANMKMFPSVHKENYVNGFIYYDSRAFDADNTLCVQIGAAYYLNPKYFQQD